MESNNIVSIDEDYFNNAYLNANKEYNNEEFIKTQNICVNILALWEILKDESPLKKNSKIIDIIEKIKTLKGASHTSAGGGKRKINSSRTKRK